MCARYNVVRFCYDGPTFEHFLINEVLETSKYVKVKISKFHKYHSELMGLLLYALSIVLSYYVPVFITSLQGPGGFLVKLLHYINF